MLDKIKNILTILLVVLIAFAVVYSIVKLIISATKEPTLLTSDKLYEYKEKGQIVTNYSTYYFLNDCLENFIIACEQEKYEELYKLYIDDYKKQYTKDEVIEKLKSIPVRHGYNSIDDQTQYNLRTLYLINNEYLLETVVNGQTFYLVFRVDETGKANYDYQFALLK